MGGCILAAASTTYDKKSEWQHFAYCAQPNLEGDMERDCSHALCAALKPPWCQT